MPLCVFNCPNCGATTTGVCNEMVCSVCGYVAEEPNSKLEASAQRA